MSENIGANIKRIRKSRGLTQNEVADMLFTTSQNISRVESGNGEPSVEMLIALSDLFDVSVDELLCRDNIHERELLDKVRAYMKNANSGETPEKIFSICKNILDGRFLAYCDEKEANDIATYSTISSRYMTGVYSDISGIPRIFAAVESSKVELNDSRAAILSDVFRVLSDKTIIRIINRISALSQIKKFYDKASLCTVLDINEGVFEQVIASLTALGLITQNTLTINDNVTTLYRPQINEEIVLLLALADLLYNESPDGNVH